MCGLAGYVGVEDTATRAKLTAALGVGIDSRGGHAAGYVSTNGACLRYGRVEGKWKNASKKFRKGASALAGITLMHARYATCGKGGAGEAHPFRIEGSQRTIWGAHNGVVWGMSESAKQHGRDYDVDSREFFHLLADGEIEKMTSQGGWGVLSWIDDGQRDHINLVKMTKDGCLEVWKTKEGPLVYASTWSILDAACKFAGLTRECSYDVDVGMHYTLDPRGFFYHAESPRITLAAASHHSRWDTSDWEDYEYDGAYGSYVRKETTALNKRFETLVWDKSVHKLVPEKDAIDPLKNDGRVCQIIKQIEEPEPKLLLAGGTPLGEAVGESIPQSVPEPLETERDNLTSPDSERCPSCRSTNTETVCGMHFCEQCGENWDEFTKARWERVANPFEVKAEDESNLSEAEIEWRAAQEASNKNWRE